MNKTHSRRAAKQMLKRRQSNFCLSLARKATGINETMASAAKTHIDCHDNASPDDVSCCSVVPAWMAINEGGATPTNNSITFMYDNEMTQ